MNRCLTACLVGLTLASWGSAPDDGLRHALQAALERHKEASKEPAPRREGRPVLAEEFAAARRLRRGECIHCHQVNEFRREDLVKAGKWSKDLLWRYPLPENVGLTL